MSGAPVPSGAAIQAPCFRFCHVKAARNCSSSGGSQRGVRRIRRSALHHFVVIAIPVANQKSAASSSGLEDQNFVDVAPFHMERQLVRLPQVGE